MRLFTFDVARKISIKTVDPELFCRLSDVNCSFEVVFLLLDRSRVCLLAVFKSVYKSEDPEKVCIDENKLYWEPF